MKHLLLITIAAVVLVGCGPQPPDISIHQAAEEGNIEAVKKHLAAGMDVNTRDNNKWTPLHLAAIYDHKEVVELFITEGANVNAKDWMGRTPLNDAAGRGYKEIVEILLANGADVNAKDIYDQTPLHHSGSVDGHKEIVDLLIDKGADVNAKNFEGGTPLDWAKNKPEIAALIRKHGGKTGAELSIHQAAAAGNIEAIKKHLAAGADVNAKHKTGHTPLDWAISNDHTEIADLLRKHGAKTGEELKAEGK